MSNPYAAQRDWSAQPFLDWQQLDCCICDHRLRLDDRLCVIMVAESKAIVFYRCNLFFILFYFVSLDKRPAMGSQPKLASRSQVMSIYKCPQKFRAVLPQIWGAKTANFGPLFSRLLHSTPHISETKRRIDKPKCYNVSSKSWYTYFPWPLIQKQLRSVTHPSAAITLQPSKLRHV